jgi:hypothetical protein
MSDADIMTKANAIDKSNGNEPRWSDEDIKRSKDVVVTKIIVMHGDGTQSEASTSSLEGGIVRNMTPVALGAPTPLAKIIVPAEAAESKQLPLDALEMAAHGVVATPA